MPRRVEDHGVFRNARACHSPDHHFILRQGAGESRFTVVLKMDQRMNAYVPKHFAAVQEIEFDKKYRATNFSSDFIN